MDKPQQLFNQLRLVVPLETSNVFWLNTHDFLPAKPVADAECKPLDANDIEALSKISDFGIDDERWILPDWNLQALGCL